MMGRKTYEGLCFYLYYTANCNRTENKNRYIDEHIYVRVIASEREFT